MRITFLGEHRYVYEVPSTEGDASILGSFEATEALHSRKWAAPNSFTATFTAPTSWVNTVLLPGRNPMGTIAPDRRARYFTIRKENGQITTMLIENYTIKKVSETDSKVEIVGADPRVLASRIPTTDALHTPTEWTGTRSELMRQVTDRLSNARIANKLPYSWVPITTLDYYWTPTDEQKRQGFVKLGESDPGGNITVAAPDPLPVDETLEDILAEWSDSELYPLETPGADATASPWWRWVIRKRVHSDYVFSEYNGTLVVNSIKGSNTYTETMAYQSDSKREFSFGNGHTPSNENLRGMWMAVKAEGHSIPEGVSAATYLRGRALTGNINNRRLEIDATVNFSKAGIEPVPGMTVLMRIDDRIVRVPLGEIVSHYSAEEGWTTTSAVFIDTDNIDLWDDTPPPVLDAPYIQIIVNGSNFSVPTNQWHGQNIAYNWNVKVDGRGVGNYSGFSAYDSPGIPLNLGGAGEHLIRIEPSDGQYDKGWADPFGFNRGEEGACNQANKDKLIKVITDDLFGHFGWLIGQFANCRNLTQTVPEGDWIKQGYITNSAYQYYGCESLLEAPDEFVPNSIPEDFSYALFDDHNAYKYANCYSLKVTAKESLPEGLEVIPNNFRQGEYFGCYNLEEMSPEVMPNSVKHIQDNYRRDRVVGAYLIKTAPSEVMGSKVETIGNRFRYSIYSGTSIESAASEAMADSVVSVGDYFRGYMYSSCSKITSAGSEKISSNLKDIGAYFRSNQFAYCSELTRAASEAMASFENCGFGLRSYQYAYCPALTDAASEVLPDGVVTLGDCYREYMYAYCTSLKKAPAEAAPDTIMDLGNGYRNSMFFECTSLEDAAAEVLPANITDINHNYRVYQYSRCSNLKNPAKEILHATVVTLGIYYRANQYSYSGIINANDSLVEEDLSNIRDFTVPAKTGQQSDEEWYTYRGEYYRFEQFRGCANLKYPLKENGVLSVTLVPNSFRGYMYAECTSLLRSSIENIIDIHITIVDDTTATMSCGTNYRLGQYEDCTNLDQRGVHTLEYSTRGRILPLMGNREVRPPSGWRGGQYRGTKCKNNYTECIRFLDGADALWRSGKEATIGDVPDSFYSPYDPNYELPDPEQW